MPATRTTSLPYAVRCEVRAIEEGHRSFAQPDGSYRVVSETQPGAAYFVTVTDGGDGRLWFACTCPSGTYRTDLPTPCKHAALAARRLERERRARFDGLAWRPAARSRPAA